MAITTTILSERDGGAVIKLTGAAIETDAVALNPTAFANDIANPVISIDKINWSISGTNKVTLNYHGSVSMLVGTYAGNGEIDYKQGFGTKMTNNNAGTNGTVLLTSTTTDPYVIILRIEKGSGFTKPGSYS